MVTGLRKQVCFAPCLYVMSVRFTELAISALGTQPPLDKGRSSNQSDQLRLLRSIGQPDIFGLI